MRIKQIVFAQAVNIPWQKSMILESSVRPEEAKWHKNLKVTYGKDFVDFEYIGNSDIARVFISNIKYLSWIKNEQQTSQENQTVIESEPETRSLPDKSNSKQKGRGKATSLPTSI